MRTRTAWLAWLLTTGLALVPAAAQAQGDIGPNLGRPDPVWPLPLYHDRPETGGFYAAVEFLYYRQTNPLKQQTVAFRGFQDTNGDVQDALALLNGSFENRAFTGVFFGTGLPALDTAQLGGHSFQPGIGVHLGWRFAGEGITIDFAWKHLTQTKYAASAGVLPPNFGFNRSPFDTFLYSPVVNFPNEFLGPSEKIAVFGDTAAARNFGNPQIVIRNTDLFAIQNPTGLGAVVGPFTIVNYGPFTAVTPNLEGGLIVRGAAPGIWNGASAMSHQFVQRYDEYQAMVRIPVYQSDNARVYGLVGPRHASIWERYTWRTTAVTTARSQPVAEYQIQVVASPNAQAIGAPGVSFPPNSFVILFPPVGATPNTGLQNIPGGAFTAENLGTIIPGTGGVANPEWTAIYSNVVSNQLWGPTIGCGSEWYLGWGFSFSLDFRFSLLANFVKERAKYERADRYISSKRSRNEMTLVPELDLFAKIWWYPIEGVQLNVGYDLLTYFNTVASPRPVSFNYGFPDPQWERQFRIFDGLSAGIGFIF
ncbi:MAG: hypothetical protein NZ700_07380 [Gemmataceae bacterium]|nr:hypothetical protein [Gemmataceae bacterium]MDW8264092.1 hypothetical protein [Gemmataceae bacterium]